MRVLCPAGMDATVNGSTMPRPVRSPSPQTRIQALPAAGDHDPHWGMVFPVPPLHCVRFVPPLEKSFAKVSRAYPLDQGSRKAGQEMREVDLQSLHRLDHPTGLFYKGNKAFERGVSKVVRRTGSGEEYVLSKVVHRKVSALGVGAGKGQRLCKEDAGSSSEHLPNDADRVLLSLKGAKPVHADREVSRVVAQGQTARVAGHRMDSVSQSASGNDCKELPPSRTFSCNDSTLRPHIVRQWNRSNRVGSRSYLENRAGMLQRRVT